MNLRSHFRFTQGQRNGILFLCIIITTLQALYFFLPVHHEEVKIDDTTLNIFHHEIDSLKKAALEAQKPKVYPFNPNFLTDYKGYVLGMTNEEIDRLKKYRAGDRWINSAKQFQQVTKVSDTLLTAIAPYFRFPEWITHPKKRNTTSRYANAEVIKTYEQKADLNTATVRQLKRINGIGDKLAERIVRFRNKFPGGFIADVQLQDVYGIAPEVRESVLNEFTVKTPRQIDQINLNQCTSEQLVTIPHIDYELAAEILDQSILREGFKNLDELLKVKGFPEDKYEIIALYLYIEK